MSEGAVQRRFWPGWAPRALAESLLIVFSVVLALAVSEWADGRRTAARVKEMRGYLIEEIKANRAALASDRYLPHHQRLKQIFGRATGVPGQTVSRQQAEPALQALFKTGLHQASLQDAVWTSVSSGDLLAELRPREMFALAGLYRMQANSATLNRSGYENALGLLDVMSEPGSAARPMMRMTLFLEDLVVHERNLIARYDTTLKVLGEAPAR